MTASINWMESELEDEFETEQEYEWENEPGIEYAVIGQRDDRFHIPARRRRPGTLLFPFNTICLLETDTGRGTGTLIAPQVVLTAKHVLMRLSRVQRPCRVVRRIGPWRPQIRVSPGAGRTDDGRTLIRPATPTSIIANRSGFRAHPELDYGVIILPRPFRISNQFMILQARGAPRTATLLTIAGYPCDKPVGSMWGHSNRIPLRGVTRTHLFYTIDTCPGHSGSPIWLLGNNGIRLLLGIHTNGPALCVNDPSGRCRPTGAPVTPVAGENCGVRITCAVIDQIVAWCRAAGVTGPRIDGVQYRRVCAAR
jgi:V8-like Glu-specific endopeptidase